MFFLHTLYSTIASPQFLLATIVISFSVKTYFLSILIPQGLRSTTIQKPWWFLLGILAGSMFGDIAWVIKLFRELVYPSASYGIITFFIRLAWGFLILQYQSLALFIESLTEKNFKLRWLHKILLLISISISCYFFFLAFFGTGLTDEFERQQARESSSSTPFEITVMRSIIYYLFNILFIPSLYVTFKKLRSSHLPLILKKQLRIFIQFLIFPYVLIEFLQAAHFLFDFIQPYLYSTVSISTMLLIYAIYYCLQQVMGLRFLNFASQVKSGHKVTFIDDFKNVLDQLSYTTNIQELNHIIQTFFKDAFDIPPRKCMVYIRSHENKNAYEAKTHEPTKTEQLVENFMRAHEHSLADYIKKNRVLIYDEIAFTNFYDEDEPKKYILNFLEQVNADIFLPIYEKQKIVAYVIVERHARLHEFYSNVEHDEMVVFANYLGNILNLLKNRNFEFLLQQEKELRDELYSKNQEIHQYQESIRSFLRSTKQKEIGIVFYKNRRFLFGNQIAKEIIKINLNTQEGHPLTQACKTIARQVEEYKSSQTMMTKDAAGNKFMLCGVPNIEHNNVIIIAYYPEISDMLTKQIVLLKDPSKWDYLLYLETTHAGSLINHMIPGSGEHLLHFKINFLKVALSKKASLLEFPDDDLQHAVEMLHHISGREKLHTISLTHKEKNYEMAHKLFGHTHNFFMPLSSNASEHNFVPLLKKLDETGTLYIHNVDLLDIETQEHLADYIQSGSFRVFKNDQKIFSNVRIICSTNQNVQLLLQDSAFSKSLYQALHKTVLVFPSFTTLQDYELHELIDGFTEQALKTQAFKNVLELTDKEKARLLIKRPTSLHDLKNKVQQALILKSKKNYIYQETQFDPAYSVSDPELVEAARLGKHALRDPKLMALLWNKFKNQNQIASFLGVNRSSVNRRCKDYNLQ